MHVTRREKRESRRTGTLNLLLKYLFTCLVSSFSCGLILVLLQEGAPVDEEEDDDDEEEEKGKKGVRRSQNENIIM